MRDGRAVASSLLHVNFWRGWYGPQGWRAGLLSPEDQATWESYDRSFTALAGLEWRIQMRAIESRPAVARSGALPRGEIRGLLRSAARGRRIRSWPSPSCPARRPSIADVQATAIKNSQRWRDDLTAEQQAMLDDLLRDDLSAHGYGAPPARSASARPPLANAQR